MTTRIDKQGEGFSLLELFFIAGILAVLLLMLLPSIANRHRRSSKLNCTNNLKQIGLSFKTFAIDNEDRYPFEISITNGGTMELKGPAQTWKHFSMMSNDLSTPKILACPNDTKRKAATSFGLSSSAPYELFTNDMYLSYFVGLDASEARPQVVLSGDRCIGMNKKRLGPGIHSISTNTALSWVESYHNGMGNVLLADGSVQQLSSAAMQQRFVSGGLATNRVAVP